MPDFRDPVTAKARRGEERFFRRGLALTIFTGRQQPRSVNYRDSRGKKREFLLFLSTPLRCALMGGLLLFGNCPLSRSTNISEQIGVSFYLSVFFLL